MAFWAIIAVILSISILMICTDKSAVSNIGKALLSLLMAFAFFFGGAILSIFLPRNIGIFTMRNHIQMAVTLFLIFVFIVFLLWKGTRRKVFLVPVAILFVLVTAMNGWSVYEASLPAFHESASELLEHYAPFPNGESGVGDRLVLSERPATLTLEGELPVLDGATALYPVYSSFFRAVYPDSIEPVYEDYLKCSTTTGAYEAIVNGDADIIFVAEASQRQAELAREQGVELVFTPIGSEAFVFVVNRLNPVKGLTVDEIRSVYSGEITSWRKFGVLFPGHITAFQREEGSGSQTAFEKMIMPREKMAQAPVEEIQEFMMGLVSHVADYRNFPGAIGYTFRFYSTQMLDGDRVRLLEINGIAPTLDNIANGTYPLAGNFYAVTRADADGNVQEFLRWMQGEEGQELVEKVGYSPLH